MYDGSAPVCELNGSGTVVAVNDFGADGVWARHTTTTDWFYTFDPQGCMSQKIGRDGSVLCSSIYDAQGHEATTDTHPDPFSGYGGQWGYYADWETSTTGGGSCLYLLGHRFYDPDAGRFINRDPISYDGGINLYAYTGNDPVNRVDPLGFSFGPDCPDLLNKINNLAQDIIKHEAWTDRGHQKEIGQMKNRLKNLQDQYNRFCKNDCPDPDPEPIPDPVFDPITFQPPNLWPIVPIIIIGGICILQPELCGIAVGVGAEVL